MQVFIPLTRAKTLELLNDVDIKNEFFKKPSIQLCNPILGKQLHYYSNKLGFKQIIRIYN
jgi:hypothetical protein